MTDFEALMLAVEKHGGEDATPLLALADWCDENNKSELAYTFRWCAADGFRPYHRVEVKRYPWEWIREQRDYRGLSKAQVKARWNAILAAPLFNVMNESGNCYIIGYKSCLAAYEDLSLGLRRLRDIVEYGELPAAVVKPVEVKLVVCRDCGMARDAIRERCPVCSPPAAGP